MRRHNPAFIPRNHLVEEALQAATGDHDLSVMERLLDVLATPYDHDRDLPMFSAPAPDARPLPHVLRHVVSPGPTMRDGAGPLEYDPCPSSPVSASAATESSPGRAP